MRLSLPPRDGVKPNTLLRLDMAVALAGLMTASGFPCNSAGGLAA